MLAMASLRRTACSSRAALFQARLSADYPPSFPLPRHSNTLQEPLLCVRQRARPSSSRGRPPVTACAARQQAATTSATPSAAPSLTLCPGQVHLWWLDPTRIEAATALQHCSHLLTPEELEAASAAPEPAIARERALARALLRSVLAQYLPEDTKVHPRELRFSRNAHGKPSLAWPPSQLPSLGGLPLGFNLTHTASLIGLAVGAGARMGLDVEACSRRTRGDPLSLARRRFSPAEVADLEACAGGRAAKPGGRASVLSWRQCIKPGMIAGCAVSKLAPPPLPADGASRDAHFLRLWTLKEAYVKALGTGLMAPPGTRSFAVRVLACTKTWHAAVNGTDRCSGSSTITFSSCTGTLPGDARRCWEALLLQPSPDHLAALCVERLPQPFGANGRSDDCDCSHRGSTSSEQLQLLSFEAEPWSAGRQLDVPVIGRGCFWL